MLISNSKIAVGATICAALASVTFNPSVLPAAAATVSYGGDTTGQPTWTTFFDSNIPYSVQQFTVDTAGTYTFQSTVPASPTPPQGVWFRQLYLYENNFNPNNFFSNFVFGEGLSDTVFSTTESLTAATNYFLVTTGFDRNNFGTFNNSISGPGNIALAGTSVPEPISILGSIIGGGVALRLRRKLQQADRERC
jgi:hypothetical protein